MKIFFWVSLVYLMVNAGVILSGYADTFLYKEELIYGR